MVKTPNRDKSRSKYKLQAEVNVLVMFLMYTSVNITRVCSWFLGNSWIYLFYLVVLGTCTMHLLPIDSSHIHPSAWPFPVVFSVVCFLFPSPPLILVPATPPKAAFIFFRDTNLPQELFFLLSLLFFPQGSLVLTPEGEPFSYCIKGSVTWVGGALQYQLTFLSLVCHFPDVTTNDPWTPPWPPETSQDCNLVTSEMVAQLQVSVSYSL